MIWFGKKKSYEEIFLKDIYSGKQFSSNGPKYIVIDITNRCNLNCMACWTYSPLLLEKKPHHSWFKDELSFDVIRNLIVELKKMGTMEIRLTGGGEPFLHPRIMDIIRLIKKNNFRLDITTNFTLMNKERIDFLIENKVDNITISLWAASSETYKKTHPNQKETRFLKILENLKYLNEKKKNTKVVISNVISNLNYTEIEDMMNVAKKTEADEVYFTLIDSIEGATDKLLLNKKQQENLRKKFIHVLEKYQKGDYGKVKIDNPDNFLRRVSNMGTKEGVYDSDAIYKIPCTVGWTFSRILANGDVAPCCRGVMIISGNINKERFSSIWNGKRQQSFRKVGLELKSHPKFVEKVGCIRSCDNVMHNAENHGILKKHHKIK